MIKKLKEEILANQRAFFATLVAVCTLMITLFYNVTYNTDPNILVAIFPIILWVAYDGNEHEKGTVQGYWFWVLALILSTLIMVIYPLF